MSALPVNSVVLSFEDARQLVEYHAANLPRPDTEIVELVMSGGRVLAEPLVADRDIPPFPRATRDGYAVRSPDLHDIPARVDLVGEIKAGEDPDKLPATIGAGQAVSIMTGAPVPSGADAVVMIEHTVLRGNVVEITRTVTAGENVVPRGAEAAFGSTLCQPGTKMTQSAVALAASVGKARLCVYKRPRVAVLTTGDEIVGIEATPGPTQIRNSNSYSLAVQIQQAGGEVLLLPIAPDDPAKLRQLIEGGLQADLLLMTGGVSMGRYDFVEQVLSEMSAEFFFTGAKIQPGRPVVFGRCTASGGNRSTYFFGLPGNPVSTMVTFELFCKPILEALTGQLPTKLRFLHARAKTEIHIKTGLTRFLPAVLSGEFENVEVELARWQGSGDIAATARASCYIVISPDRAHIPAHEWVPVLMR
ncbi:MAG TPA: gephyrin-like molybdotransferase Glp [Candidatus Solibacter sp.]|nr:gephyrin-like molybdotransferase Glp [Candidatus Solibacter sp.]